MARAYSATPARLGLEGIVSKRKDSMYRSGHSPDWLKMKNPEAAAVKREAEEAGPVAGCYGLARRRPAAGPAPATAGLRYATRAAMPCCLRADDRGSTRRLPPLRDRGTRSSR